jgi:hypothetical protein
MFVVTAFESHVVFGSPRSSLPLFLSLFLDRTALILPFALLLLSASLGIDLIFLLSGNGFDIDCADLMFEPCTCEDMVAVIDDPLMEAIELEFDICFVIFACELIVLLVLSVCPCAFYFLFGVQSCEFPVDYAAFLLVSHEQVEPFELFYCIFAHPFLH